MNTELSAAWVLLTLGDRPQELAAAVESIWDSADPEAKTDPDVVVVVNGADGGVDMEPTQSRVLALPQNLGVPGGRNCGMAETEAEVVFFLDDDAVVASLGIEQTVRSLFEADPDLAVVSFRIVDETGSTARRHIPRPGSGSGADSGEVVSFLGGASAIRRSAFDQAGGYFADLFYAHEELDLAWRLIDAGWKVRYQADLLVEHPHTPIGRHPDGWRRTGRNRVIVARRNLPIPIAAVHVLVWLAVGVWRAPGLSCRRSYVSGWINGWRQPAPRRVISWRTVLRLTRLRRPPII